MSQNDLDAWIDGSQKLILNGEIDQAQQNLENALKHLKDSEDDIRHAKVLEKLSIIKSIQKKTDEAKDLIEKALQINEKNNNFEGMINCFGRLGFISQDNNDLEKAMEYYEASLSCSEKLGNKSLISSCLNKIGYCWVEQNKIEKGIEYYHKALSLVVEINDRKQQGQIFSNIGSAYEKNEQFDEAIASYETSFKISGEPDDFSSGFYRKKHMIDLYVSRNKKDREKISSIADQYLHEAKKHPAKFSRITAFEEMASIYLDLGEIDKVKECIKQVDEYILDMGIPTSEKIKELKYILGI